MANDEQGVWTVTSQKEDFQLDDHNQPVNGVLVYFNTARGHKGSVFVPASEYTPDRVRALIRQKAATMDAVGMLTGA